MAPEERTAREAMEMARTFRGLSFRDLAYLMNMESSNVFRMLRGSPKTKEGGGDGALTTTTVARLCAAMSVSLAYRPGLGWAPIYDWHGSEEWEGPPLVERPHSYFEMLEQRIAKLEEER